MSLIILTKSPKFNLKEFINNYKKIIKFLLGQKRGPAVVTESLIRGLNEIDYKYLLNPRIDKIKNCDFLYINESVEAVNWAIQNKIKLKIKKLIIGPAIVNIPDEKNKIMHSIEIDKIILPSDWNREWWCAMANNLKNKYIIWPAGVNDFGCSNNQNNKILIFYKNKNKYLLNQIIKNLNQSGFKYKILRYGYFSHKNYINYLKMSKIMIYLGGSESQGLALHEAWMANVRTLVYDVGMMEYKNFKWHDNLISAPYITADCGLFFKDIDDYKEKFDYLLKNINLFQARKYSLKLFTNYKCAKNFINIINSI